MAVSKALKLFLESETAPPSLSALYEPGSPDSLVLAGAANYKRVFAGNLYRRSFGSITKRGLLQDCFEKSCLLKVKADISRGFDISIALYPSQLDLAAWGIIIDRPGRVFQINSEHESFVEMHYQHGSCGSKKDWLRIVGEKSPDEYERSKHFYTKLNHFAGRKITISGCAGFGFWDVLWMTFDMATALEILTQHTDFAKELLEYWNKFHVSTVQGMLDAGIKIIFLRENPNGFNQFSKISDTIDNSIGHYYQQLASQVESSGGMFFFDCDNDAILNSDLPYEWGFHGVGPMIFADESELTEARELLHKEMILIGSAEFADLHCSGNNFGLENRPEFIASRHLDETKDS